MSKTVLHIAAPCAESWAAMTPAGPGRHCAACQKTVVDFSQKTDAEILAYFKQAGAAIPCGRFRASQLGRPLLPAVVASPAQRWRGWVAAALALWGLRAEAATLASATQPPSATRPRSRLAPAARTRQVAGRLVSGVVRDQELGEPVARAKVMLRSGHRTAIADANGYFRLWIPVRRGPHSQHTLVVQRAGFATRVVHVPLAGRSARALKISLLPETHLADIPDHGLMTSGVPIMETVEVVTAPDKGSRPGGTAPIQVPGDAPNFTQPPHHAWYHWLTRLFRRS